MARKYNMATKYGMAIDLVSDNVSNIVLIGYLINRYGIYNHNIIIILFMSYMISISYGLNEAIACYKETGNDNFYSKRVTELKGETNFIFTLFLTITKMSYSSYKLFFPTYNEDKIYSWLKILKHFGPGNYCLVMCFVLLNL
jgi:phosphatidylglycerophosphate synthase